jgi:hypothetical protein
MKTLRILIALIALLLYGAAWGQPATPAGKIDLLGGDVRLQQAGKPVRAAQLGEAVYEGDTLITGKDSEAHVTMQDTGFLALRPNTTLQIVAYTADGGDDDKGVFKLLAGGLRSITGWIGKFNRKSYTLRTPTATIGIRGTDHETHYIPPGSPEGESGTYDKVYAGETSIQTDAGQAAVVPDHAGYVEDAGGRQPRVLPAIPAFFRPGPHEDIINRKHAEIQQMIMQRREERRKVVAQKLAELISARRDMRAQAETNKAAAEERKAADEAQRENTEARLAALRSKNEDLQQKQKSVVALRKAIFEKTAVVLARRAPLREQMKTVRETWKEVAAGYREIAEARKALSESNAAATESRKAAAEEQRKQTEIQLLALNETAKALQDRQQAQQMQQDGAKAVQEQAAALNGAANETGNKNELNSRRRTLHENAEALGAQQREYQDALNALYERNVSANEERMRAAAEQRRQTAAQLAALRDREAAMQQKLMSNEDRLEEIQRRCATLLGNDDGLVAQIDAEHQAVAAQRALREDIQTARWALHDVNTAAIEERQQAALEQLKAMHARHREVREKGLDLMNERNSMQQEIRSLMEQEQKRYQEELKADRQLGAVESSQGLEQ